MKKKQCLAKIGSHISHTLGDPGAVSGAGEKSKRARKKFGLLAFSSPDSFSRRSRLFPGPTN